jgi:hypothetical protein
MPELPTVSALVAAYNYERYVERAINSALAQDYPPELLEVVVVDDGSTDATAEVVAEVAARNPQRRVTLLRQSNAGATAAANRALAAAGGDVLAMLDADDMWAPSKIRRNVEMLAARPALGLVFSDMAIVGPDDEVQHPSLFAWAWQGWRPPRGQVFARLLAENFATASSITVRASLRAAFDPIPDEIPYGDWWLATSVARVAELDYCDEPLALYRLHGANLTGGVAAGPAALRERRKDLAFQLWCLRNLPLETLSAGETAAVWEGVENKARLAVATAGSAFVALADVPAEAAAEVEQLSAAAARLAAAGDHRAAATTMLRAVALDPYRPQSRERLRACVEQANAVDALADPLAGSRRFVALADAGELIGDPELLLAFAASLRGETDVTLAIDASTLEASLAIDELRGLVDRCGLAEREDIHLVAVVGALHARQRERMLAGTHAFYSAREDAGGGGAPTFTPASLDGLRAFAASAAA